jgi:RimJ/RimL family protein N-acetyltransferase
MPTSKSWSSHRRRGVATALLRAVDAWAKDAGVRMVWVDTHIANDAALALYASAGFLEFGVVLKKEL